MECKLSINLSQGLIAAEGSEDFVLRVYSDFKDKLSSSIIHNPANIQRKENESEVSSQDNVSKQKLNNVSTKTIGKKKRNNNSPSINKNLHLYEEGSIPSLKDFVIQYDMKNNYGKNVVFVYYLKELKSLESVTENDIYTCYDHMEYIIPLVPESLRLTASRKGWIDTSKLDDIQLTVKGRNAIKHELLIKQDAAA